MLDINPKIKPTFASYTYSLLFPRRRKIQVLVKATSATACSRTIERYGDSSRPNIRTFNCTADRPAIRPFWTCWVARVCGLARWRARDETAADRVHPLATGPEERGVGIQVFVALFGACEDRALRALQGGYVVSAVADERAHGRWESAAVERQLQPAHVRGACGHYTSPVFGEEWHHEEKYVHGD
jgi:hypothetical protein